MTREERVTLEAYRSFTPVVREAGRAVVLQFPQSPDSPMVNRAVGLGAGAPATEQDVEEVLDAFDEGVTFYVALGPDSQPAELLPGWLAERGLEPGWGWMSFARGLEPLERRPTELALREVASDEDAASFGRIVRTGYGLPEAAEPVIAGAWATGWRCWLALHGDEPTSAAAMYVGEGAAYLGFAATLPEHRGKGAQNALLAERIEQAGASGCDIVLTETGEMRDDLPSNSYRNILRAGFRELRVTANWVGRR